jgi:hypothetical protein
LRQLSCNTCINRGLKPAHSSHQPLVDYYNKYSNIYTGQPVTMQRFLLYCDPFSGQQPSCQALFSVPVVIAIGLQIGFLLAELVAMAHVAQPDLTKVRPELQPTRYLEFGSEYNRG